MRGTEAELSEGKPKKESDREMGKVGEKKISWVGLQPKRKKVPDFSP